MALKLPPYPIEYLDITFLDGQADTNEYSKLQNEQILPFAASSIFNASLKSATYLSQGNDVKTVINVCLNIEGSGIQYLPGNTFGIVPQNSKVEVEKIIDRLKCNDVADRLFNLSVKNKKNKIPVHVPFIGTIRNVLLRNLDIRSIPKKSFLRALSKYTTNSEELYEVNELSSVQGSAKYTDFITTDYVSLLALLQKFPSCHPPVSVLFEHLPRLQPRPYSVSCSPLSARSPSSEASFVFSLTELPNSNLGVCTGWLKEKADTLLKKKISHDSDLKIPVYFRKPNTFQLANSQTRIIMIASGTGLAPFIGFLEHRAKLFEQNNQQFGAAWLFYGCRYSNRDFLYKDTVHHFLDNGILTKLFTCFSRENSELKYVQDKIQANSLDFIEMLDKSAVVYVCGGKKMSDAVSESIVNCLADVKHCPIEDARKMLQNFKNTNKYIEDVWS